MLNDTRVMPARLRGKKATGGAIELLLTRCIEDRGAGAEPARAESERAMNWEALGRNLGWAAVGTELNFERGLVAEITRRGEAGAVEVRLRAPAGISVVDLLEQVGQVPLPPYIEVARKREVAAAPTTRTASPSIASGTRRSLRARRARSPLPRPAFISPLTSSLISSAQGTASCGSRCMWGWEPFARSKAAACRTIRWKRRRTPFPAETAQAVNEARQAGRPVVAVGTTVVRALESSARADEHAQDKGEQEDGGAPFPASRRGISPGARRAPPPVACSCGQGRSSMW